MSKKSIFNKVLLKKELRSLYSILFVNTIFLLLSLPFATTQLISSIKHAYSFQAATNVVRSADFERANFIVFSVLISCVVAVMIFGLEKSSKSLEVLVTAPFTRAQIYFNKILAGILVTAMPLIVILFLNYMIISTNDLLKVVVNLSFLRYQYILYTCISFTVFCFFIMISMFFGNAISSFIFGALATFFPAGYAYLFYALFFESTSALPFLDKVTPMFILLNVGYSYSEYNALFFLIYGILFLFAGYALFSMSKMEKNSEFLTFKSTEKIFSVLFSIGLALLGGVIVSAILGQFTSFNTINKIIGCTLGALAGYFIQRVLILKNKAA